MNSQLEDESTIIVIDTNILLSIGKFSVHTSNYILKALDHYSRRIYIPYQVMEEYESNKNKVFGDVKKRYVNLKKSLSQQIDNVHSKMKNEFNQPIKLRYVGIESLKSEIDEHFDAIHTLIQNYNGKEEDRLNKSNIKAIQNKLDNFVLNIKTQGRVGVEISLKERLEILREGELRFRYRIPPGYMDIVKKDKNTDVHEKEGAQKKFGDLFIWKEILKIPMNWEINKLVFVTDDEKEDWWEENGEPRKELQREFKDLNPKMELQFMGLKDLLENYSKESGNIEIESYLEYYNEDDVCLEKMKQYLFKTNKLKNYNLIFTGGFEFLISTIYFFQYPYSCKKEGVYEIEYEGRFNCVLNKYIRDNQEEEIHFNNCVHVEESEFVINLKRRIEYSEASNAIASDQILDNEIRVQKL